MKSSIGRKLATLLVCSLMLIALAACAGRQNQPETAAAAEKAPAQATQEKASAGPELAKLPKKYSKVFCTAVSATPAVVKDYPSAAADFQSSLLNALTQKKLFNEVGLSKASAADAHTLIVKANITDLRIVSAGARIWGGAFAGSSYVNADVQLIDGATQKIVRKEALSSANNAWAASWTGGHTDYSIVSDMGRIVADYVAAVNPAR